MKCKKKMPKKISQRKKKQESSYFIKIFLKFRSECFRITRKSQNERFVVYRRRKKEVKNIKLSKISTTEGKNVKKRLAFVSYFEGVPHF